MGDTDAQNAAVLRVINSALRSLTIPGVVAARLDNGRGRRDGVKDAQLPVPSITSLTTEYSDGNPYRTDGIIVPEKSADAIISAITEALSGIGNFQVVKIPVEAKIQEIPRRGHDTTTTTAHKTTVAQVRIGVKVVDLAKVDMTKAPTKADMVNEIRSTPSTGHAV